MQRTGAADREKQTPRAIFELDYLLLVNALFCRDCKATDSQGTLLMSSSLLVNLAMASRPFSLGSERGLADTALTEL